VCKFRTGIIEPFGKAGVIHRAGLIYLLVAFVGKHDLGIVDLDLADVFCLGHLHKGAVVDLLDADIGYHRRNDHIEKQYDKQNHRIIVNQRFFWRFDFFHL